MKRHALAGRKQSPEHIRRRVEAVAKKRASWSLEQSESFSKKISEAIKKRPKEMREKFIFSNVGREPWNKGKENPRQSGPRHWNWGGKMSQESIEKMRKSLTGKKQSLETIAKRFASRNGYTHSEETRKKISETNRELFAKDLRDRQAGENSPSWKGGISFEPYPTTWNFSLREAVRNRDGRKCRACGKGENGIRHDVHHVDYDKMNIKPDNLVTLCHPCHMKTQVRREEWIKFFSAGVQATA